MSEPVRILLVDDHAVLRSGLRLLLEREEGLEPVGEASTAEEALRALPRLRPDMVVMDVEMPGMGGLEGIARVIERAPDARVLVLSMHDRPRDVRRAFDSGAHGYLPKAAADEDLVRAIRAVASGQRYVHPSLGAALATPAGDHGPLDDLTAREREVLRLRFVEDLTQAEIGARIGVSQMQVSRLIRQALARLRMNIERAPAPSSAVDAA